MAVIVRIGSAFKTASVVGVAAGMDRSLRIGAEWARERNARTGRVVHS
jgi:hypothetical protein